ncbi:hypothetical protein HYDPIDRAFT_30170 [Hydnomerulius pinastri MD-312]|uniref:Unplaced genomic scaffold scaffold_20, whole genome shotgun sequence n=1 Tax=Hydnomerulius pinastri MD-312 TaxID=994086 RepID=A0A0C9VA50_9AGAM|nr:hypothetical protein HYDPIDRAFT_30170 [Hydnomerulius pinastri MD-312]
MTIEADANGIISSANNLDAVPLRSGPPTLEELRAHYPARFTWQQLKTFVNSGDLGLLKRDKKLQVRYNKWAIEIKKQHGSVINYLLNHRLRWGKPDTLSLLTSALDGQQPERAFLENGHDIPSAAPEYFKADISFNSDLICIIQNDWPYSGALQATPTVPPEIEHTLVWTRIPIFHNALVPTSIDARIQQDGLCGFTGSTDSEESLPSLESCLPALADWGVTMDKLIRSSNGSEEEEAMVQNAGREVRGFVKRRWAEREWETAWFVNPPRLQSVPGLAHIHVFARKKAPEEVAAWGS